MIQINDIKLFAPEQSAETLIPMFNMSVAAGIPMPVDEEIDNKVDLNEFLVTHPFATFFAQITSTGYQSIGIQENDILIIDTITKPQDGKIVAVLVNDTLTIKIFRVKDGNEFLVSENDHFIPLKIEPYFEFKIIGVVTNIIHTL